MTYGIKREVRDIWRLCRCPGGLSDACTKLTRYTLKAILQQITHKPVEDNRCRGRDILFRPLGDSDIRQIINLLLYMGNPLLHTGPLAYA